MDMRNDNFMDDDARSVTGGDAELAALDQMLRSALRVQSPAGLAERICVAGELDQPLRVALRIEAPAGLTDRIVAASAGELGRRGVVARIGMVRIAASVALLIGAGVWATMLRESQHTIAIAELSEQIDRLGTVEVASAELGTKREIRDLAADVEQVAEKVQSASHVQFDFAEAAEQFSDDLLMLDYEMQSF